MSQKATSEIDHILVTTIPVTPGTQGEIGTQVQTTMETNLEEQFADLSSSPSSDSISRNDATINNLEMVLHSILLMSYPDIKLLRDEDLTQEMEDFMMVEKETFSSLGLRTRMLNRVKILQQYILNNDALPPLTMDYKELIHIVRQIMSPNGGDISVKSNTNLSVATSTTGFPDNAPATVLALKELKIKDIPKFSGDFDDLIDWYNQAKDALGNNH